MYDLEHLQNEHKAFLPYEDFEAFSGKSMDKDVMDE